MIEVMKIIGVFKVNTSFNITNRGIAAYGYLIEGKARVGCIL